MKRAAPVDRAALIKASFEGVAQLSFEHRERAAILLACPESEVNLERVANCARARSVPGAMEWYDANRKGVVAEMEALLGWTGIERADIVAAAKQWGPAICYCVQNAEILKGYCRNNGLKLAGKKKDLQERVFGHLVASQGSPSSKEAKVEEQVEVQEPGAGEKTLVFSVVLQSRTALFHVASSVMFEVALAAILSLGFNFLLDHCYEAKLPRGDVTLRYSLMRMWSPPRTGKVVFGDDTRVAELNLIRGDSFTLHFDFGDSYRFLFSVLEEIAGREENDVRLLSATGDPVLQYPGSSFDLLADD